MRDFAAVFWVARLRNKKQIGLEQCPEEYIEKLGDVFREVKRVLHLDGTLWLNLADSYREKELIGLPWRMALALQADGWYLRQDIIWHKPNPMPESVTDRCTKGHEYIFLLSKSADYYSTTRQSANPPRMTAAKTCK
jgi:site-specific DNA-methyltransferase (adenine-specific)